MYWINLRRWLKLRAASYKKKLLVPHLDDERILDVGTGNGGLQKLLHDSGFQLQGLDIKDKSLFGEVNPKIYDGQAFPFPENAFHTGMFITVLHHTPDPEKLLAEAVRCAKRIIIVEDIYRNTFQKYLTFFTDSLVNLEFSGHPHTNKTDNEWKALFKKMNLNLTYSKQYRFMLFFRQVIYVLDK